MTQKTVIPTLKANLGYLHEQFGVKQVAVFGSFASGTAKRGSDVDLVVEFDRPVGLKFMRLAAYLEKLLGRKVDLLTKEGLKGIRSRTIARNIQRSLKYV